MGSKRQTAYRNVRRLVRDIIQDAVVYDGECVPHFTLLVTHSQDADKSKVFHIVIKADCPEAVYTVLGDVLYEIADTIFCFDAQFGPSIAGDEVAIGPALVVEGVFAGKHLEMVFLMARRHTKYVEQSAN